MNINYMVKSRKEIVKGSAGSILSKAQKTPAHAEELPGINLRTANGVKELGRKKSSNKGFDLGSTTGLRTVSVTLFPSLIETAAPGK